MDGSMLVTGGASAATLGALMLAALRPRPARPTPPMARGPEGPQALVLSANTGAPDRVRSAAPAPTARGLRALVRSILPTTAPVATLAAVQVNPAEARRQVVRSLAGQHRSDAAIAREAGLSQDVVMMVLNHPHRGQRSVAQLDATSGAWRRAAADPTPALESRITYVQTAGEIAALPTVAGPAPEAPTVLADRRGRTRVGDRRRAKGGEKRARDTKAATRRTATKGAAPRKKTSRATARAASRAGATAAGPGTAPVLGEGAPTLTPC